MNSYGGFFFSRRPSHFQRLAIPEVGGLPLLAGGVLRRGGGAVGESRGDGKYRDVEGISGTLTTSGAAAPLDGQRGAAIQVGNGANLVQVLGDGNLCWDRKISIMLFLLFRGEHSLASRLTVPVLLQGEAEAVGVALADLAAVPDVGLEVVLGSGAADGAGVAVVPPDLEVDAVARRVVAEGQVGDLPLAPSLGDIVALSEGGNGAGGNGRNEGGGGGEEGSGVHFC